MCTELIVNVEAHAEGYVGQTVSIGLHEPDCPGHPLPDIAPADLSEPHDDHAHE